MRIRATLGGPVVTLLSQGMPQIGALPADHAYDRLMGDIGLLHQSFAYFRAHRDAFHDLLRDGGDQPVADDITPLSCGRSLEQVVAMIVRSGARRYFRKRHARGKPVRPAKTRPLGLLRGLIAGLTGAAVAQPAAGRPLADEIYHAVKDHLLYEWQLPLTPAYAELRPAEIRRLGARMTELRTIEALRDAVGRKIQPIVMPIAPFATPEAAKAPAAAPAKIDAMAELVNLLSPDGEYLRVTALTALMMEPDIRRALSKGSYSLAMTATLGRFGGGLARQLVEELGLDRRQLTVCLARTYEILPEETFERFAQSKPESVPVRRFIDAAHRAGMGPETGLVECAAIVTNLFSRKA